MRSLLIQQAAFNRPRPQPAMEEDNPYELQRAAIIAANRARLAEMGIVVATTLAPAPRPRPPPAPGHPNKKKRKAAVPTRASARQRGGPATRASGPAATTPPWSPSTSPPPSREWDPAELAALAAHKAVTLEARLSELSLAGLIDAAAPGGDGANPVAPAEARFAVVGAPHKGKRKHYVISLTRAPPDGKQPPTTTHACECMDFRMRRSKTGEACKHIALVLNQLGCGVEGMERWPECLQAQVMMMKKEVRERESVES